MKLPRCLFLLVATMSLPDAFAKINHVIGISLDGCRGDFLKSLIETKPADYPNFVRLRNSSAHTFNARCDVSHSITIPNHLCMLTGRPVTQPAGLPPGVSHGYISNSPPVGETIHANGLAAGIYKASIFDMVHDRGMKTSLIMGKDRMRIAGLSWDAANGAPDTTGEDNGTNKIDFVQVIEALNVPTASPTLVSTLVGQIETGLLAAFSFLHIADADYAGHSTAWSIEEGSHYRATLLNIDAWLGQILDAIENNPALTGKVALLLTADHGGGSPSNTHLDATALINTIIPFFVMAPGITGGTDLHGALANRHDPGLVIPAYADPLQPVRNGDMANLATALLGLPPVTGSLMSPELKRKLSVSRTDTTITVEWPVYLTDWTLESCDNLFQGNWISVAEAPTETNGLYRHTVSLPHPENRFYRLKSPAQN